MNVKKNVTCNQLNTDSNSFCVKCKDEYPYFFNEKSECKSECNDTILINGDMKYCIINCEGNNTYGETDGIFIVEKIAKMFNSYIKEMAKLNVMIIVQMGNLYMK